MDKNVLVDQSSTSSFATTIPSSTSFSSHTKANTTRLPLEQLTSVFSSSEQKGSIGDSEIAALPFSSTEDTMVSTSSSISKLKAEVDQLDDLVKDLLTEVNRPLPSSIDHQNSSESTSKVSSINQTESVKPIREERIRIKRGTAMEVPVNNNRNDSSSMSSHVKPNDTLTSIDEQLIDSLLESVQNTLRKRAQHSSSTLPIQPGGQSRRAHSSSSAYTDSVHRMEPIRTRFPIKLNRSDSPTSSISSRRPYSRDGYLSTNGASQATHFRATSEPPPDGPIELRRMDLVRSPSRTYFDAPPMDYYYYPRAPLPYRGYRTRGYDHSGYESDTGSMGPRVYPNRFYRAPPPMYPNYYYQRPMVRTDGYDTDSGLISSGRLRMARPSPTGSSRMAVIPETYMLNNRMVSSSNINGMPMYPRYRTDSYTTGYDTDSGINTRYSRHVYQPIPVQREEWVRTENIPRPVRVEQNRLIDDQRQVRSTSIPVVTEQDKRKTTTLPAQIKNKDLLILAASVGLSNPINRNGKMPQNQSSQSTVKRDSSKEISMKTQETVAESSALPVSHEKEPIPSSTQTAASVDISVPISKPTPLVPVTNQSYDAHVQARVKKNNIRYVEENSRRSSLSSTTGRSVSSEAEIHRSNGSYQAHNVSRFWYKEKMSREDAIQLLKNKPAGTFLIRDSQGFPGSFGLAVKVETLPTNIQPKPGADPNTELVRHYLIERTPTGHVRLKGCPNEPDFASLSELVYHHTVVPLALPTKLILPTVDITENYRASETKKMSIKDLLERGAACNVVYLNNVDVESLSGQMAVAKALNSTFENVERLQATIVNFKVSTSGITLVDNKKKLFSRRHFPREHVIYCGGDYEPDRFWTHQYQDLQMLPKAKCFAFVSKKLHDQRPSSADDFECHVFAELDPTQPASAIVNFVSKVMIGSVPV